MNTVLRTSLRPLFELGLRGVTPCCCIMSASAELLFVDVILTSLRVFATLDMTDCTSPSSLIGSSRISSLNWGASGSLVVSLVGSRKIEGQQRTMNRPPLAESVRFHRLLLGVQCNLRCRASPGMVSTQDFAPLTETDLCWPRRWRYRWNIL